MLLFFQIESPGAAKSKATPNTPASVPPANQEEKDENGFIINKSSKGSSYRLDGIPEFNGTNLALLRGMTTEKAEKLGKRQHSICTICTSYRNCSTIKLFCALSFFQYSRSGHICPTTTSRSLWQSFSGGCEVQNTCASVNSGPS